MGLDDSGIIRCTFQYLQYKYGKRDTCHAGAIGVSNIMMVTVKERTTEIGIRRAIGASPKDILQQILSESMVLTTVAGMAVISFAVLILQILESAPMARRMPISVVRSFTVTIMILDTPIAPANKVPKPTIQIRMRVPVISVSIMENMASALRNMIACLSSGEM